MKFILLVLVFASPFAVLAQSGSERVCGEGEEYTSCGSSCPDTCETIMAKSQDNRPCTMNCVPGCFCQQGKVRDTVTNKCVETFHCKQPRDSAQESAGGGSMAFTAPAKWIASLALLATLLGRRLL